MEHMEREKTPVVGGGSAGWWDEPVEPPVEHLEPEPRNHGTGATGAVVVVLLAGILAALIIIALLYARANYPGAF